MIWESIREPQSFAAERDGGLESAPVIDRVMLARGNARVCELQWVDLRQSPSNLITRNVLVEAMAGGELSCRSYLSSVKNLHNAPARISRNFTALVAANWRSQSFAWRMKREDRREMPRPDKGASSSRCSVAGPPWR